MANSLGGFLSVYAQEALPQLIAASPVMSSFTTDFSSEVADGGASIVTRLPSTTYTANDTDANGYQALAATSSAVTVTLKQRDITHAFSELEWTSGTENSIYNAFVPAMTKALINYVSNDVLSVVTLANYSTSQSSSLAGFSGSAVTKLSQVLSTANVPNDERTLIIAPTYFEVLRNSVNSAYYFQPNNTETNYAGFKVQEYSNIPTTNNLVGIAAHKSSIAVATRVPSYGGAVEQQVMTDPVSGATFAFRQWHSADDGKWKLAATIIYGYAKGNASSLVRIVT